ncbi:MAG: hypothetical protein IJL34_10140 [Treponema sp.]|nr:hypothetical protein [Treponema sp.]
MNQKNITDQLRNRFTADLAEFLAAKYDVDVCQTAAGTIMIPAVDGAGDDRWVKFSCIIPKDADEANGTDGYSLAHEYQLKLDAAAARKEEAARKAADKKAKAEERAAKAAAKAAKS